MLKKCHLLTATILLGTGAQAQQTHGNRGADSVSIYLERSLAGEGTDTVSLNRAITLLDGLPFDSALASKIINVAEGLKARKRMDDHYRMQGVAANYFLRTGRSPQKQAFYLSVIGHYEATRDSMERPLFLKVLIQVQGDVAYFTDKLERYLALNDSDAVSLTYFKLSAIYHRNGLYDLEIYNLKKALSYLNPKEITHDGTITGLAGWTNHTSLIGALSNDIGDHEGAISWSVSARDARLNVLKDSSNVPYTSCNIAYARLMMGRTDSILEPLDRAEHLAERNQDLPALARCYEMKGFYYLKVDQLDSSERYLGKCRALVDGFPYRPWSPAGTHLANYYLAQVRMRQGRLKEARQLLEEEIPLLESRRMEQLKEYKLLIEVALELGDAATARDVFLRYSTLQAQVQDDTRKNRVTSFETEQKIAGAENIISELEAQQEISRLTRNFLVGIAALLFVVAIIIFNRFMVTRRQKAIIEKEKKRSEELLLNILPEEVAEELKEKGAAEAKLIDHATVLFTDFKGFTAYSENLSPQQLVHDLNECFTAFDNIIARHGMEKIKTIGDAYMAAGGLPVANATHATDVVKAALEIRDFIAEGKARKVAAGLPYFEIRIGIHTGPVVAGIVGVKKFSYDIWGDTVNTASRMESSGEVGQVNISEATYELVKDEPGLTFTPRGKVQAKGKGQMEMYFVGPA